MVMAMLPFFIEWTVSLKCFASLSQNIDEQFEILFIFLIFIFGIF